jgi:hypothetical protein
MYQHLWCILESRNPTIGGTFNIIGISECIIKVDPFDLFSIRPDDDSIQLKRVVLNVII